MKNTPAQQAIALLIELAEKGEIDPWDVQVIEVIDRFLSELVVELPDEKEPGYTQTNLSRSGQAFLWASMLILLKANTLNKEPETDIETEEELETELEEDLPKGAPAKLEKHLRRRAGSPPVRKRRVTLEELIREIQEIEKQLTQKPEAKKPRALPSRRETSKMIASLAHQENLIEVATFLEEFLAEKWKREGQQQKDFELQELVELLKEPHNNQKSKFLATQRSAFDRVGVFWALLLLSSQSKVELSQEAFYQDLKIGAINLGVNQMNNISNSA